MYPKSIVWKGHRCLEFDNGVIVGQAKVKAVLAHQTACATWLKSLANKPKSNDKVINDLKAQIAELNAKLSAI